LKTLGQPDRPGTRPVPACFTETRARRVRVGARLRLTGDFPSRAGRPRRSIRCETERATHALQAEDFVGFVPGELPAACDGGKSRGGQPRRHRLQRGGSRDRVFRATDGVRGDTRARDRGGGACQDGNHLDRWKFKSTTSARSGCAEHCAVHAVTFRGFAETCRLHTAARRGSSGSFTSFSAFRFFSSVVGLV